MEAGGGKFQVLGKQQRVTQSGGETHSILDGHRGPTLSPPPS
uniref:Uncharacterized protein n=1 Tax=Trichinella nativa TaxID=6335 RepID=A0A0V1KKG8_9BILA